MDALKQRAPAPMAGSLLPMAPTTPGSRKAPPPPPPLAAAAATATAAPAASPPRWQHLIAGTCGGLASTVVLHPADLIRVRYQVNDGQGRVPSYGSLRNAVRQIAVEESWRGFYRGLTPAILGSALSWGSYFWFYEHAKQRYEGWNPPGQQHLAQWQVAAAALEGGAITLTFTNPFWLLKTRLQVNVVCEKTKNVISPYRGVTDAIHSIWRSEGIRGFYRGFLPALALTSHGMIQFSLYEKFKRIIDNDSQWLPALQFIAAGASKVVAAGITYPMQVIKSRIMQRQIPGLHNYTHVLDALWYTARHEGIRGFYRGFMVTLLRVVPQSAITLSTYEAVLRGLRALRPE